MTEHHIQILEASEEKAARRSEAMEELRDWIDGKHRDALEENPYGTFVSRAPIGTLAHLSPTERAGIDTHERGSFDRHQPIAQAKARQLSAFVQAGGNAESFRENWERSGRDGYIAGVAAEQLQRAHNDGVF